MSKQHSAALVFFLLVAVATAVFFFWRSTKLQERLEASIAESARRQQALEQQTNARIATERQLEIARSTMSAQDAALLEVMQRIHVIHDVELELTVEATPPASDEDLAKIPVFGIELRAMDGRSWRFISQHEQAPPTERVGDVLRLAVRCVPLRLADLQGKPVQDLASVAVLHTQYQNALTGVGYGVSPASTKRLVLRLDGIDVVDIIPAPMAPDGWEYDVASGFAGLYERYLDQLRARVAARASSPDAATPANP